MFWRKEVDWLGRIERQVDEQYHEYRTCAEWGRRLVRLGNLMPCDHHCVEVGIDLALAHDRETGQTLHGSRVYGMPVRVVPERGIVRMVEEAL